jgi:hypothetical protein
MKSIIATVAFWDFAITEGNKFAWLDFFFCARFICLIYEAQKLKLSPPLHMAIHYNCSIAELRNSS